MGVINGIKFRKLPKNIPQKFELTETYRIKTNIRPTFKAKTEYLTLFQNGVLVILRGFRWDGATLFPDIKSVIRGSLIHDALYTLLQQRVLLKKYRKKADEIFRFILKEDKMPYLLRIAVYSAVRMFGASHVSRLNKKEYVRCKPCTTRQRRNLCPESHKIQRPPRTGRPMHN